MARRRSRSRSKKPAAPGQTPAPAGRRAPTLADEIFVGSEFFHAAKPRAGTATDPETTAASGLLEIPGVTFFCRNPRCEKKSLTPAEAILSKDGFAAKCPACGERIAVGTAASIKDAFERR